MTKITFEKELALNIGLNESIVLEKLYERIEKEGTPLNGQVWIERTYEEWQVDFPFWSISTLKRIFKSLKKQGLILTEQHGKHRYDRTNWYALPNKGEGNLQENTREDKQPEDQADEGIEDKISAVQDLLQKLRFFPLRAGQNEELVHACRTFSIGKITEALEATAARAIFAWKYAYKVLLSSKQEGKKPKRKIIRTELVPEWLHKDKQPTKEETSEHWSEELLEKKRRLERIQEKYRAEKEADLLLN